MFPCLEELTIKYCSNLKSIPDLSGTGKWLSGVQVWGLDSGCGGGLG